MTPNITHSTGSGRYLGYNLGTKKDRYQKVRFLAYEGVIVDDELIDELNKNWQDDDDESFQHFRRTALKLSNDLDRQFRAQAALNERPKIKAINISLSYSPLDTDKVNQIVYDEVFDDYVKLRLKMLREFLTGMKYIDSQWVAVEHLETHCAHDHVAINTIRNDGTVINTKFDYVRAQRIAKEIKTKYGLSLPDESLQMITPKAKTALEQSCTIEEYKDQLGKYDIKLIVSDHSQNGRGYGLSYSFGTKVIPGSKLHRSLSYGRVMATLAKNLAARQEKQRKENIVMIKGYDAILTSIGPDLDKVKREAFILYEETQAAHIAISSEAAAKYKDLQNTWAELGRTNKAVRDGRYADRRIEAIGRSLTYLNPILGLIVVLVAKITSEIRKSAMKEQQKQLLTRIDGIRRQITELESKKAELKFEKDENLQKYLVAKNTYKEYRSGLNTIDGDIEAIKIELKKAEEPKSAVAKVSMAAQLPEVIHVTPTNYRNLTLPEGYRITTHGELLVLGNQVIPTEGLYLVLEKGRYLCMRKQQYDILKNRREGAKVIPRNGLPGQKIG